MMEEMKQLASIRAPSGQERGRAMKFVELISEYVDSSLIEMDSLFNIVIKLEPMDGKNADKIQKVMVSAHLDEIGGTVLALNSDGRVNFTRRGGFESRWLTSKRAHVLSDTGNWLSGVISGRTVHAIHADGRDSKPKVLQEMELYLGAENEEDLRKVGVHVGAPVCFGDAITEQLCASINPNLIVSNSLDDIIGLMVLHGIIKRMYIENDSKPIKHLPSKYSKNGTTTLLLVASVREEIGREGALYVARKYKPDICVGLDFAVCDKEDKDQVKSNVKLESGGVVVWAEATGRCVFDYELAKGLKQTAIAAGIPVQDGVFEYYGSDSGILQQQLGVPSVLLAIPMRNGHNVPEIASLKDIGFTTELLLEWLEKKPF